MNYILFLLVSIFSAGIMQAKVLIYTYSYNRPDFIEIQHKTFKKFIKDEYEFVVFNDAPDETMARNIVAMCNQYQIPCIRIPQVIHQRPYLFRLPGENYQAPAVRNCNVVQYSLNEYGFNHDDILVLIDSDLFVVREFSFRDYLKDCDIAGLPQGIGYLWIGLVLLNMQTLPNITTLNFNCGRINNVPVDAGGYSYHYIHDNPSVRVRYFSQFYPQNFPATELTDGLLAQYSFDAKAVDFIQAHPSNVEFLLNNCFLHYRSGTNWDCKSSDYHARKMALVNNYINALLQ